MSREIKFRVWLGERFWFFDLSTGFNNENKDICSSPEQYTGLKDKNGKEIYKGDIVLHAKESNMTSECTMIGPYAIGWNNYEAHFELIDALIHGRLIYKAYEVIGNIHETPELLK